MIKRIIFWQNLVSPHFAPVIRALAELGEVKVLLVVESVINEERKGMGWNHPELGKAGLIVNPTEIELDNLIASELEETLHIFSGTRAYKLVWKAFRKAVKLNAKMSVVGETGDWQGIKGKLRLLRAKYDAFLYKNNIHLILAIGKRGESWYRLAGFPANKIFPWAYFLDSPQVEVKKANKDECYKIIFVGRLSKEKGVDLLIESIRDINENFHLTIIGEGHEKEKLTNRIKEFNLSAKIEIMPFIPHQKVFYEVSQADLLVLPSTGKDGWGAVVNEALMVGTPVVCSTNCGAADVLQSSFRGEVFNPWEENKLAEILKKRVSNGKVDELTRARIKEWSAKIQPQQAAEYLLKIINYTYQNVPTPPTAPWEAV